MSTPAKEVCPLPSPNEDFNNPELGNPKENSSAEKSEVTSSEVFSEELDSSTVPAVIETDSHNKVKKQLSSQRSQVSLADEYFSAEEKSDSGVEEPSNDLEKLAAEEPEKSIQPETGTEETASNDQKK